MSKLSERYDLINKHGGNFQGRKEILAHLNGETMSARQAIKAKCYDCMGYFEDGRQDCKIVTCPIYPWMPYREGGVRKRIISDEQKKAAVQSLKKAAIPSAAKSAGDTSNTKTKMGMKVA